MNWINDEACLRAIIILAVIFGSIIITCFAMFFNYNAKLNKDGVEITKIAHRTKELEKKNGSEIKRIEKLEKEIQGLKRRS